MTSPFMKDEKDHITGELDEGNKMDIKLMATVFITVFAAEIADKTQLAILLYASQAGQNKLSVFIGSGAALILATALAVSLGGIFSKWVESRMLSWIAGIGFVAVGIWIILKH